MPDVAPDIRLWLTGWPFETPQPLGVRRAVAYAQLVVNEDAEQLDALGHRALIKTLRDGLALREGQRLSVRETAMFRWLSRDGRVRDVPHRVCAGVGCGIVFPVRGSSAFCLTCRDSPGPVLSVRRHHLSVEQIDGRWRYEGACQECGGGFTSLDPRAKHCANCGDDAGRGRRKRQRDGARSRGTQRVFRYAGIGRLAGQADFTITVNRGNSHDVTLHAIDSIIETEDAEAKKQLDTHGSLAAAPAP